MFGRNYERAALSNCGSSIRCQSASAAADDFLRVFNVSSCLLDLPGAAHSSLQAFHDFFGRNVDEICRKGDPSTIRESPEKEDGRDVVMTDVGKSREHFVKPCQYC